MKVKCEKNNIEVYLCFLSVGLQKFIPEAFGGSNVLDMIEIICRNLNLRCRRRAWIIWDENGIQGLVLMAGGGMPLIDDEFSLI